MKLLKTFIHINVHVIQRFSLKKQQQVDPGERKKTNFDGQAEHDVKEACFANNYPVQAHKNSKIYVSIFFL